MVVNERNWARWLIRMVGSGLAASMIVSALTTGVVDSAPARKRASAKLVQDFSNATAIAINDGGQSAPSTIAVSGFATEVADVEITVRNLNHGRAADVDMLLIGPQGQTAVFLSDAGGNANNATLTFDDKASNHVVAGAALVNGTFQPTNFQSGDFFSPPAPQPTPTGSGLGVFHSTDPNGAWTLVIRDDASDSGTSGGALNGGWSLRISSANGVPNASPDSFSAKAGKTLSESAGVLANDTDPDDDLLTAILAGTPRKGTVQLQPDGSFTYRPGKKAKGTDSFTYLAQDPGALSDLETATIKIQKARKKGKK